MRGDAPGRKRKEFHLGSGSDETKTRGGKNRKGPRSKGAGPLFIDTEVRQKMTSNAYISAKIQARRGDIVTRRLSVAVEILQTITFILERSTAIDMDIFV